MPRFDVHAGPPGTAADLLLDVQSDNLSHLTTRIVVPLVRRPATEPFVRDLTPTFEIAGERHALMPNLIAAVPRGELGRPVANLEHVRDAITRALDILLTGV